LYFDVNLFSTIPLHFILAANIDTVGPKIWVAEAFCPKNCIHA